jgi:hypothetical protein
MRCATLRTVLASERPPCASARCADSSSASVVSSSGLATPRVPPRAMRRTDFCLLTCLRTSTRASSVPGASNACAPAPRGKQSPGSHQSDSLRWAARPCFWFIAMGVLLPVVTRADRTSDIPVASSVGARPLAWCGDRRRPPRPFLARSRERYELVNDPGCLPSGKDPRPATPSRAPGSGLRWTHGLATVIPDLAASFTPGDPCESSGGQVPVHAPRCQRETRFSGPRRRLPTSATCYDARAHPDERSTLAREWSFRPATRRHQPMPVALALSMRCRLDGLRAAIRTQRLACAVFHLRGRDGLRAETLEQRRSRVLGRIRACPPRDASGTRVTDSTREEAWRTSSLVGPA